MAMSAMRILDYALGLNTLTAISLNALLDMYATKTQGHALGQNTRIALILDARLSMYAIQTLDCA